MFAIFRCFCIEWRQRHAHLQDGRRCGSVDWQGWSLQQPTGPNAFMCFLLNSFSCCMALQIVFWNQETYEYSTLGLCELEGQFLRKTCYPVIQVFWHMLVWIHEWLESCQDESKHFLVQTRHCSNTRSVPRRRHCSRARRVLPSEKGQISTYFRWTMMQPQKIPVPVARTMMPGLAVCCCHYSLSFLLLQAFDRWDAWRACLLLIAKVCENQMIYFASQFSSQTGTSPRNSSSNIMQVCSQVLILNLSKISFVSVMEAGHPFRSKQTADAALQHEIERRASQGLGMVKYISEIEIRVADVATLECDRCMFMLKLRIVCVCLCICVPF